MIAHCALGSQCVCGGSVPAVRQTCENYAGRHLTGEMVDAAWWQHTLVELEAHVRALPPFEDAVLAPSLALRLIEAAKRENER